MVLPSGSPERRRLTGAIEIRKQAIALLLPNAQQRVGQQVIVVLGRVPDEGIPEAQVEISEVMNLVKKCYRQTPHNFKLFLTVLFKSGFAPDNTSL